MAEEKKEIEDILAEPEKEDLDIEEAVAETEETKEEEAPDIEPERKDKEEEEKEEKNASDEPKEEKAEEETTTPKPLLTKVEKKSKKKWVIVAIVAATILITAAIVLGIVYWLTARNQTKKDESNTKTTAEETEDNTEEDTTTVDKSVYVNEAVGLNLRKEPNINAEILATMPQGTKLIPLETSGEWIKVEYNGKTGWCMVTYTSSTNPLVYNNTDYSFSITFPSTWAGYKIFKKDMGDSIALYVAIPTTDTKWTESDPVEKGYASLFAFGIYTKAKWEIAKNEEMKPTYLGEKGDYVITWSSGQATPTDLTNRFEEIKSIIDTFKLI